MTIKSVCIVIFIALISIILIVFRLGTGEQKPTEPTDQTSSSAQATKPLQPLYGAYEVIRVVDGDTIVVDIDNVNTTIRLIGIDAPESVHPQENKNTNEGQTSSNFLKEYLKGKYVFLEYDIERLDKYNRTLAYVYLDENTMIQKVLLENGLAKSYAVPPNTKYKDDFEQYNYITAYWQYNANVLIL